MTSTTTATAPLAVTDLGQGDPALVFVPGWCGSRSVFDGLAARAAAHRRVLTVDLPDHGESPARDEVSTSDVVDGIVERMQGLGIDRIVPVTLSHAGWAAVELRRRLGAEAVPAVVLLDWMVLGTPPGFADALAGLQSPAWADVRAGLTGMWTDGLDLPELRDYVASMCSYGARHWQRAGREIQAGFAAAPVPLEALAELQPCPVLHLYAQPADDAVLAAQQQFAATHPWFSVTRLEARSHFPMFEVPDTMAAEIESFVAAAS
ncbi:alpha/beta fold hydrolase [uncultured Jatrophihabitans sp.]|uniref:alpha/beta fold hydrolase n=1 Tax=uncultured Jatrophihabitans sp. TaxID=1610747 RepID=UPI0035CB1A08